MSDQGHALRIGLAGCGRLAQFGYLPAFELAGGIRLVGVADTNRSRCEEVAPGIPAYDNLEQLIHAGGLDGVVIATPTRCHVADATIAAHASLPALLEKPPGLNLGEARQLLELSSQPWLAFNRRHDPDLVLLKKQLPQGEYLDLRVELHYRRTGWSPFDMHDDALLDLGPHLIDLGRWLTGSQIQSVQATMLRDRRAEFTLQLARGRLQARCSCDRPYREIVQARAGAAGELGTFQRGGIIAGIVGKLRPTGKNPLVDSLVRQLEAFGSTLRGTTPAEPLALVADGVAVMEVIEALRQSATQSGSLLPVASPTSA